MTDNTQPTTRVAYILDRSGSMASCREQAIAGTNEYFDTLARKDPDTRVSVTLFDTEVYRVITSVPVREITPLTPECYIPDGCTALYDAVGSTIAAVESEAQDGDVVLVSIFTDGEENSSREFSRARIFDLIRKHEEKGWTFVYLGANQDAWVAANSMGIAQSNAVNFSVAVADAAFAKAGRIQAQHLRARREHPGETPGVLFATRNIEDEPEPEPLPDNQWKARKGKK